VLGAALRDIASYDGGAGTLSSTTGLGLLFDKDGHLSLDTTALNENQMSAILDFLGSASGGGFLKSAADVLNSVQHTSDGVLQSAIQSLTDQISDQDDLIAAGEDRIELLREGLFAQMAAADAMIAALEQKVNYMTNLFEAMRINSQNSL
jgi:flagellar capping protein FliD